MKFIPSLIILSLFLAVRPVDAHILQTNSKIGALMHIDPDDNPIINQPANFFFDFKDPDNKFKISDCDCKVEIKKGGQQIYSGSLQGLGSDQNSAAFSYTFTDKGDYTLLIDGDPKHGGSFAEFSLNYPISVTHESVPYNRAGISLRNLPLLAGIVMVVSFFVLFLFKKFINR